MDPQTPLDLIDLRDRETPDRRWQAASSSPTMLRELPDRLAADERVSRLTERLRPLVDRALPPAGTRARSLLRGEPLGHPAHPPLTDLPIGFWTSAFVLDLVAPRRGRTAARRLIGLGILTAVPTVATGLSEWSDGDERTKRVGTVHAISNAAALLLYLRSWRARRRGHHARGRMLGFVAAGAATFGGYLGGGLAFPPKEGRSTEPGAEDAHGPG